MQAVALQTKFAAVLQPTEATQASSFKLCASRLPSASCAYNLLTLAHTHLDVAGDALLRRHVRRKAIAVQKCLVVCLPCARGKL